MKQSFWTSQITNNAGLKALSFVIALALYSLVHGSQDTQHTLDVRLDALPPPKGGGQILMTTLPARVSVTVRGPKIMLDEVHADELGKLEIDLRTGHPSRVSLDASLVKVPPGITVEQIEPPYLDLDWEERIERDVPIGVAVAGTPPAGLVVRGLPITEPRTVHVDGPKSLVSVLQSVRAEPFDVSQVTEGEVVRTLALSAPPQQGSFDVRSVSASLRVGREILERTFERVEIAVAGVPRGKASPPRVDVRLSCSPPLARSLRAEQVVAVAEVPPGPSTGSVSRPVVVKIAGCEVTTIPSEVVVRW